MLSTSFIARTEARIGADFRRAIPLNHEENSLVEDCIARAAVFEAGREIAAPEAVLAGAKYVVSGWVGLIRLLNDGRRQIVDVYVAGELTAFDPGSRPKANGSYVALTPVRLADASGLLERASTQPNQFPGLASMFRLGAQEATCRLVDQIVRVGRMLAHERIAHFALDLYRRFDREGLCQAQSFPMPLTQEVLGDVLGMSTVHINRTLQQLRRDNLLRTINGRWEIVDIEQLNELASGSRSKAF